MYPGALLTQREISIFVLVDVTRPVSSSLGSRLRQPDRIPLLLPGARSTGKWRILLPRPFATTFDLSFARSFRPHLRMGPFFRQAPPGRPGSCRKRMAAVLRQRLSTAFFRPIVIPRVCGLSSSLAALSRSPPRWWPEGPAHPLERGLPRFWGPERQFPPGNSCPALNQTRKSPPHSVDNAVLFLGTPHASHRLRDSGDDAS